MIKFKSKITGWKNLKETMTKLDNSIPDYVFDDEDGEELAKSVSDVWDAINDLDSFYRKYNMVKK